MQSGKVLRLVLHDIFERVIRGLSQVRVDT